MIAETGLGSVMKKIKVLQSGVGRNVNFLYGKTIEKVLKTAGEKSPMPVLNRFS